MPSPKRYLLEWAEAEGNLRAFEPTLDEVTAAAPRLAAYYNDAHNSSMMAHEGEMSVDDVLAHFTGLWADGDRPFLLERGGVLMGDADLRHVTPRAAEFAIMIGERQVQGKGIGTRFAALIHAFAYQVLALERIYISIIPANTGSQRLFEKLGYVADDSAEARAFADEDDDLTLSLARPRFEERHALVLPQLRFVERS